MDNIIQINFETKSFFFKPNGKSEETIFPFSIHIYSDHVKKENNSEYLKIYISGFEKFFDSQYDIENNFVNKFKPIIHAGEQNIWDRTYEYIEEYKSECMVLKCEVAELQKIVKENIIDYTVIFQLTDDVNFSAKFKDNDAIYLDIFFKNFNKLISNAEDNICFTSPIYPKELPFINYLYAKFNDKENVQTVPKGSKIQFYFKANDTAYLYYIKNGTKTIITNVSPSSDVEVNEDSEYILEVTKNTQTISQKIQINIVSPIDVIVSNSNGERVNTICKGEKANISWSKSDVETISLCDENKSVISNDTPYSIQIFEDRTFYLKLERNDCIVYQEFRVYCTQWNKEYVCTKMPFKPDGKGYNKFYKYDENNENIYYIYVHPNIFKSSDLEHWDSIPFPDDNPEPLENIVHYSHNLRISRFMPICLTCKDKIIFSCYLPFTNEWHNFNGKYFTILNKPESDLSNKFQFCHVEFRNLTKQLFYLFAVYEHKIDVYITGYDLSVDYSNVFTSIKLPEDAANAKIVSIDTFYDFSLKVPIKMVLAILFDNKQVYLYDIEIDFKNSEDFIINYIVTFDANFDIINEDKVYLVKSDSIYFIFNNHVCKLSNKIEPINTRHSPLDLQSKDCMKYMTYGNKYTPFSVISSNEKETSLWTYIDGKVTPT